jgi:hypothetical protein
VTDEEPDQKPSARFVWLVWLEFGGGDRIQRKWLLLAVIAVAAIIAAVIVLTTAGK